MINKVTITGADDSISPDDLLNLTAKYPFVEWGILLSRSSQGGTRFPSREWLDDLNILKNHNKDIKLAGHLCGAYVRELLSGYGSFIFEPDDLQTYWHLFDRYQINTHGQPHQVNLEPFFGILEMFQDKQFIFQYDEVPAHVAALRGAAHVGRKVSALFDLSHGTGVLPESWPEPLAGIRCGYAGGLSPENLEDNIQLIEAKVGNTPIWIDMETHVRSNEDLLFDLNKVETCLQIASKYVVQ